MCRVLSMEEALDLILALKEMTLYLIHFKSTQLLSSCFGILGGGWVREEDQLAEPLVLKDSGSVEEELLYTKMTLL